MGPWSFLCKNKGYSINFVCWCLLFLCYGSKKLLQGCDHTQGLGLWCLDLQFQTCFFNSFDVLLQKRRAQFRFVWTLERYRKALHTAWGKTRWHHIQYGVSISFTSALCVRYMNASTNSQLFPKASQFTISLSLLVFRTDIQELLIALMLVDSIKHAFCWCHPHHKHFPFSVKDKLLEVQGHNFCDAEILCVLRNDDFHFLTSEGNGR